MQIKEKIRLSHFEIIGLFGEHDYLIPIKLDSHITAIIAPNGAGKTLCLRLISALFAQKWSLFEEVVFTKITYSFTDGHSVSLTKSKDRERGPEAEKLNLSVTLPDGKVEKWSPKRMQAPQEPIERYLPFLTRVGSNRWQHDHTGQSFTFDRLVETYKSSLPRSIVESAVGSVPKPIAALLGAIYCRLIETQRLLVIKDVPEYEGFRYGRESSSTLAITEKAESLKKIISSELNNYATLSQSLDRSFPRRLIAGIRTDVELDIASQLAALDASRKELMDAGILDAEVDQPVVAPSGKVNDAIAQVLQVHIDDNKKKLASLGPLLRKIKLFKKLIDQRFVTKDVQISKKKGIEVNTAHGEIGLDRLSSGEQHQLVLFFELLFEIRENSLILIDEPELSLHVAWQKKFIGDLLDIIELNKFDVVLATHSPQLISRWDDLVVELGDVYGDDGIANVGNLE